MIITNTYQQDLMMVARRLLRSTPMFFDTLITEDHLLIVYGDKELLSLKITPNKDNPKIGTMRLRTRTMSATWHNVPVGFSCINHSKTLVNNMRTALNLDNKANCFWYIGQGIKRLRGEQVDVPRTDPAKKRPQAVFFKNGHRVNLVYLTEQAAAAMKERCPYESIPMIVMVDLDRNPIAPEMTASECVLALMRVVDEPNQKMMQLRDMLKQLSLVQNKITSVRAEGITFDQLPVYFDAYTRGIFMCQNEKLSVRYEKKENGGKWVVSENVDLTSVEDAYEYIKRKAKEILGPKR